METLVLAAALRVIGPAVQHGNAELEQPDGQPGPALTRRNAPGPAVVDEERLRQSITPEHQRQPLLHRVALFVGAGRQADGIARMIIDHRQGMAAHLAGKPHPALEVHLPQKIGRGLLEALLRRDTARRRNDPGVPAQDRVHRRSRRTAHPIALQTADDLAGSPGRMGIAHLKHPPLDRGLAAPRAPVRTARPIHQLPIADRPAVEPFIAGGRMDPEPPAQLAPVRPLLRRQPHKLQPLVHPRHLAPWHGWPPRKPNPCNDDVSAMSPNTRRGCLRAIQQARQLQSRDQP